jgi:Kip1 ubiquitination-promoting complex protein 1
MRPRLPFRPAFSIHPAALFNNPKPRCLYLTTSSRFENPMNILQKLGLPLVVLCCSSGALANQYSMRVRVPGLIATPPSQTQAPPPPSTYATWNANDKSTTLTLSSGNLVESSSSGGGVRATVSHSSGKWYWETTITALATGQPPVLGLASAGTPLSEGFFGSGEFTFFGSGTGTLIYGSFSHIAYGANTTTGDVIGVAADLDNRQITFYKNGASMGLAYTSTLLPAGTYFPYICDPAAGGTSASTTNFGQAAFKYTVPSGYNSGWY